ncbi:MAG: PD-(D/E)XK nuclease domain-containing protein [Pseudobutyrivibrio sp.]|nr:PD-(D/E)XK nuclease domain-containing protein [Pseudobutyrivibrio sp.]
MFEPEIIELAKKYNYTFEDCQNELKKQYDGYNFSADGLSVYNPFSLLNSFADKNFGSYWFSTRTPTFLLKKMKEDNFEIQKLTDKSLYASESALKDYTGDNLEQIPLLYQSGYLTIADFDITAREYTLSFPNEEVKYGFLEGLLPLYVEKSGPGYGLDIFTLRRHIEAGNLDKIRDVFTGLFANITYTIETDPFEHYFQMVIYLVFTLLGKFAICEMHTYSGRVDCVLLAKKYIYLFEFKRDDTADSALKQIDDSGYALPFKSDDRRIYRIGVSFDSKTRMLKEWKVKE